MFGFLGFRGYGARMVFVRVFGLFCQWDLGPVWGSGSEAPKKEIRNLVNQPPSPPPKTRHATGSKHPAPYF